MQVQRLVANVLIRLDSDFLTVPDHGIVSNLVVGATGQVDNRAGA